MARSKSWLRSIVRSDGDNWYVAVPGVPGRDRIRRWAQSTMRALTGDPVFIQWFGGKPSASGVNVTVERMLSCAPVIACVKVIAEAIASLPCIVYEKLADGGRRRATELSIFRLLRYFANPEMTAFQAFECAIAWLLLRGNAYFEIERNEFFEPIALWPIPPDRITPRRFRGEIVYDIHLEDEPQKTLPNYLSGVYMRHLIVHQDAQESRWEMRR